MEEYVKAFSIAKDNQYIDETGIAISLYRDIILTEKWGSGSVIAPRLENGNYVFNVCKNLTRKTNSNQSYLVVSTKTETSNRKILLPDVITNQLAIYIQYKQSNGIPSQFFFGGDRPIAQRTYQRYFEKFTIEAGLKKIRIHDLRHSHASMLIHLNVPITVISKRLGHSSIEMTLKKYAHCYASGAGEAIAAVDNAIANLKCGTSCGTFSAKST